MVLSSLSLTETFASKAAFATLSGGAAEGGVDVDFDATILVQILFIVLLLVLLKPVLFDPMMKLFEEREKKIDGAKLQARRLDEKSAQALSEYETALSKTRGAANAEKEKMRLEAQAHEAALLSDVRKKTESTMDIGRSKIEMELTAARTALQAEANGLAREVASRVLGRQVQ